VTAQIGRLASEASAYELLCCGAIRAGGMWVEIFLILIALSAIDPLQIVLSVIAASLFRSWMATLFAGVVAAVTLDAIVFGLAANEASALYQPQFSPIFWDLQFARFVSCLLSVVFLKACGRVARWMLNARRAARMTASE
jgi:hypothetical protein